MSTLSPPSEFIRLSAHDHKVQTKVQVFWSFVERSDGAVMYSKHAYILDHVLDNLEEFRVDQQIQGGHTFTKKSILERSLDPFREKPILCWLGFQGPYRFSAFVSTRKPDFV